MKKNVILEESDIFSLGSNEKSLQQKVYDTLVAKFMNRELVPGQIGRASCRERVFLTV